MAVQGTEKEKDNHLDVLSGGDRIKAIKEAILRADAYRKSKEFLPIEIEVESVEEAKVAARELAKLEGVNGILLDNMSAEDVGLAAKEIKKTSQSP